MSAGPGEFKSTKSYTNANIKSSKKKAKAEAKEVKKAVKGACHLLTQGMDPTDEYEREDAYILARTRGQKSNSHNTKKMRISSKR